MTALLGLVMLLGAPWGAACNVYNVSAYNPLAPGMNAHTRDGTPTWRIWEERWVAVDQRLIPLGSSVWIEGMGTYRAADTGGAIVGHMLDIAMPDTGAALRFGRQNLTACVGLP